MIFYDIDSVENRDPVFLDRLERAAKKPLWRYFKAQVNGLERIPQGSCLYVGNHSSGLLTPDSYIFFGAAYEKFGLDGMPFGLAHEVVLRLPGFHQLFSKLGAIRASKENAAKIFASGGKIMVYPGGDVENMRPWRDRNRIVFANRRGYIRLALEHNVPIVPVVSAGAHETFMILHNFPKLAKTLRLDKIFRLKVAPLTLSIPWGLTFGVLPFYIPYPTRILMEVLEPIHFDRSGPEAAADEAYVKACAKEVEGRMQRALTQLAAERERLEN